MKYHCYILPYITINNDTFVLLGKKKFYGNSDGFIHNNPGQQVVIGGNCKKNTQEKILKAMKREFVEETGHYLKMEKIKPSFENDYAVGYYPVSEGEYKKFSKINFKKSDKKYVELTDVKWMKIGDALKAMSNNHPNFNTTEYLTKWKTNNWSLRSELSGFKKNMKPSERDALLNNIKQDLKKHRLYPELVNYLKRYIKKRSYVDWFVNILKHIPKNVIVIGKSKSSSPKSKPSSMKGRPSPKPASRKSSPKINKKQSPPKKYVPPHLRKNNLAPRFRSLL